MSVQRLKIRTNFIFLLVLLMCSLPMVSWALKKDVEQPVNIEADSVAFDRENSKAVYEGNVVIVQGSLRIQAERIDIDAPDNEIKTIFAVGKPVKFSQKMDDGKMASGQAEKMSYFVKEKRLLLQKQAMLKQDKDKVESSRIEYFPNNGELYAGGKKATGDRVKAIFHPTNKAAE